MARIEPFEKYPTRYERWFQANQFAYQSELAAIKRIIPLNGKGIEIGVGNGRFAAPLGIRIGIEPSQKMLQWACLRNIRVIRGVAEVLPIGDEQFDFVLMITTICFLDDIAKAFEEAHRILKADGCIILGFVDKESSVGRQYEENKKRSVFYREAEFYSTNEVISYLKRAGFHDFYCSQTIFKPLKAIHEIERIEEGYGEGTFVVLKAEK